MRKILFILTILVITNSTVFAQDKSYKVVIKGIEYDSLFMRGTIDGKPLKITAKKDKTRWLFNVPDSVYTNLLSFSLSPTSTSSLGNTLELITLRFYYVEGQDTIATTMLNFDNKIDTIVATFIDSVYIGEGMIGLAKNNDEIKQYKVRNFLNRFIVETTQNSDLYLNMKHPFVGYFFEKNSYNQIVDKYDLLAHQNPDSRYIISGIASCLFQYKRKEDLKRIYSKFSNANKESVWGKKIEKFLSTTTFENIELPNAITGITEPIINDKSIPNLIIFSASWCGPCHKLVPTIKKIYEDLEGRIEIVYISMDESKTIKSWNKFMEKEQIPWRSLSAAEKTDELEKLYYFKGIPHSLLVLC